MLLSFQPLEDVASVNQFRRVQSWRVNQGSTPTGLFFQLTDISRDAGNEYKWPGFRYVPAPGALLQVAIHNINDDFKIFRIATQPYPLQDPSIWELQLLPTDTCLGAPDILLTLTEYSNPGLSLASLGDTGGIAMLAVGNNVTITLTGTATFASLPAAGSTLVIGVDSDLYLPIPNGGNGGNTANGGFYLVTGTSTSTSITATKVSDLFYGGLTTPQSVGQVTPIVVTNVADTRVGPAVQTTSGLVQGRLRIQTMAQYQVPYRSPYTDIIGDNQTGWLGGPNGQGT